MDWRDRYWGKAKPSAGMAHPWHPLAWHSLDVAAAMQALLAVRPAWGRALAQINGLAEVEVCKRLTLVAAFHDLGKFADNFQAKVPDLYQRLKGEALRSLSTRGHGDVGADLWQEWQEPSKRLLGAWAKAAFSHHGVPVAISESAAWSDVASRSSRDDAYAYLEAVADLIGIPEGPVSKQGAWLVAGLVILADWIGSNQIWFPYETTEYSLQDYWQLAQERAKKAVDEAGLTEALIAKHFELEQLLGREVQATPLQEWASQQRPQGGGYLYIIEDLTGAGKTEAALLLAHRLMQSGAGEGLYWALPTMATANSLYARLQGRYRSLFDGDTDPGKVPSLMLSHSAADIHQVYQASIGHNGQGSGFEAEQPDQEITAEAYCSDFVAQERKKAFLAQVGVGTLDQALLGILPVRHQSLRLAALSRRILVIDEAHSFDAYTGSLMERLLSFHSAQGGSAIILTATLSQSLRQKLIKAFASPVNASDLSDHFPMVTHVHNAAVQEWPMVSLRGGRRDLPVRRVGSVDEVQSYLLDRAEQGWCGVYIRNTVEDARLSYEALRDAAPAGVDIHLFHARYTLGDRARIESDILARFGWDSGSEQRRGQILVATQVVESSLDLDFDFMAIDLCPMDLLIQRAGRLQRHSHRPARPQPELLVLAPDLVQGVDEDWYARMFPKGQHVYPDVGQLWRTLKVLDQWSGLKLETLTPRDFIEPVFSEVGVVTPETLLARSDKAIGERVAQRAMGHNNGLNYRNFERTLGAWGPDVMTPTRLGEETRTVRVARWSNGVLRPWSDEVDEERAWRLSEVQIDARKCLEAVAPDSLAEAAVNDLRLRWGHRYSPPLILPLVANDDASVWSGQGLSPTGGTLELHYDLNLGLTF